VKTAIQRSSEVYNYSGSLAARGTLSASKHSEGFARLVGIAISSASSESASGLSVYQSTDLGANWDYVTTCGITACSIGDSAFSIEVVGNAIKIVYANGYSDAAEFRAPWYLRPI